jgi:hypothetical protein
MPFGLQAARQVRQRARVDELAQDRRRRLGKAADQVDEAGPVEPQTRQVLVVHEVHPLELLGARHPRTNSGGWTGSCGSSCRSSPRRAAGCHPGRPAPSGMFIVTCISSSVWRSSSSMAPSSPGEVVVFGFWMSDDLRRRVRQLDVAVEARHLQLHHLDVGAFFITWV